MPGQSRSRSVSRVRGRSRTRRQLVPVTPARSRSRRRSSIRHRSISVSARGVSVGYRSTVHDVDGEQGEVRHTSTTLKVGGKHNMKLMKNTGTFKYFDEFYGLCRNEEGKQGVELMGKIAHKRDLLEYIPSNPNLQPTDLDWFTRLNPFALNPNQKVSGSTVMTAGSVPLNDYVNLHDVHLKYSFANFANTSAVMDVFIIQYKKDSVDQAPYLWDQSLISQAMAPYTTNPSNAVISGGGLVAPGIGRPSALQVGQHPNACEPWRKVCKILKTKTFKFAADTQIEWDVHLKFNKRLDKQYLETAPAGEDVMHYGGLTIALMYRLRGQVVKDTRATGTVDDVPTLSASVIGYTCTRQYTYSPALGNRFNNQVAQPWLLTGSTAGDANQVFIDINDAPRQQAALS